MGGKEDVLAHEVCIPPFSKSRSNPSTDLPARRKHNAVPPRLLNADPLAQIIGTEPVTDVIIDDAEACALLDSRAMVDQMSSSYAKARNFDMRPITELSDCFVNLKLAPQSSGWELCCPRSSQTGDITPWLSGVEHYMEWRSITTVLNLSFWP